MKNHIQNIELVNQYLNNELNNSERESFTERLTEDNEFKNLFDEQSSFIEGVKRYVLKGEIKQAYRTYKLYKLLKILGVTLLVVSLIITFFSLIKKSSDTITIDKPTTEIFSTSSSNTVKKATLSEATIKSVDPIVKTIESNTDTPEQTSTSEVLIVPDNQKNTTEIEQLYSSLKKQPEVFQINTAKDTVITCKEGTLIKIKANSFIDSKTNQIIKGKFQLKVTEYYKLSDIIKANLTTLANDAILETGGMLYMEASQNTTICQLSSKNTLKIEFPYEQRKKNMKLFKGEKDHDLVNWKLINNKEITPKTELINGVLLTEEPIIDTLSYSFITSLNNPLKEKVIANDKFQEGLDLEIPSVKGPMKGLKILATDSLLVNSKYDNKKNRVSINKNDISHYIFSASKLGWINCDRFINSKKTKIKFKVKVGKGADIDVKMIFKNFKAVLPGKIENENYTFSKVPIDEPVLIYAIKFENGQYYIALQNTTISNKKSPLIFEKVSLPKLKEKINKLNSL